MYGLSVDADAYRLTAQTNVSPQCIGNEYAISIDLKQVMPTTTPTLQNVTVNKISGAATPQINVGAACGAVGFAMGLGNAADGVTQAGVTSYEEQTGKQLSPWTPLKDGQGKAHDFMQNLALSLECHA